MEKNQKKQAETGFCKTKKQGMASRKLPKQFADCSEHLSKQDSKVQRGLIKPSNPPTMGDSDFHFLWETHKPM